jgi:hypothetical protein
MIGKSTKLLRKMLKMPPKLKNQMDHGGCLLLTFCCSLIELLSTRFFLRIGKYTQSKVNGPLKPMVVDHLRGLFKKELSQSRGLSMNTYNHKVMTNGSTTLNSD